MELIGKIRHAPATATPHRPGGVRWGLCVRGGGRWAGGTGDGRGGGGGGAAVSDGDVGLPAFCERGAGADQAAGDGGGGASFDRGAWGCRRISGGTWRGRYAS